MAIVRRCPQPVGYFSPSSLGRSLSARVRQPPARLPPAVSKMRPSPPARPPLCGPISGAENGRNSAREIGPVGTRNLEKQGTRNLEKQAQEAQKMDQILVHFLDQKIGPFSGLPIWRPIVRPENEPIFWSRKWTKFRSVFCASWAGFPGPRARKTDVTRARKMDQKLGPFSAPWDCFSVPRALGFSSSLRPGAACPGE